MEATAIAKNIRTSPRKARIVVNEVRGKRVGDALSLLEFSVKKQVASDVSSVIKSAVANLQYANESLNLDPDDMFIKEIFVDEGQVLKRFRPRAQGRVGRILKRMSHITVKVSS